MTKKMQKRAETAKLEKVEKSMHNPRSDKDKRRRYKQTKAADLKQLKQLLGERAIVNHTKSIRSTPKADISKQLEQKRKEKPLVNIKIRSSDFKILKNSQSNMQSTNRVSSALNQCPSTQKNKKSAGPVERHLRHQLLKSASSSNLRNQSTEKLKSSGNSNIAMTLKSASKNWNLPHNKYNYPHMPVEQRSKFSSLLAGGRQRTRSS